MMPAPQRLTRLLLIDDHADLAEATAEFLRNSGLEVSIVASGSEALNATRMLKPDVILCDLNLPDMSGLDIARRLRNDPNTKNILFIVHTALAETDLRHIENGHRADIDLFLSKPLTDKKLHQLLSLLDSRRPNGGESPD